MDYTSATPTLRVYVNGQLWKMDATVGAGVVHPTELCSCDVGVAGVVGKYTSWYIDGKSSPFYTVTGREGRSVDVVPAHEVTQDTPADNDVSHLEVVSSLA